MNMIQELKSFENSIYSDLAVATMYLKVLHHEDDGMFEVCIHPIRRSERGSGINGAWFKDHNYAAQHLVDLWCDNSKKAYTTFNPVKESTGLTQTRWGPLWHRTADDDIIRLVWVYIDFDPIKAEGDNATDEEKQAAHEAMYQVDKWLAAAGIRECIMGDSGNGGSLFIPIKLPKNNESRAIIGNFLAMIATWCQQKNLKVKVDTSVQNFGNLCPLFPTWARKGEHTTERPHRKSAILRLPKVENLTIEVKEANTAIIKDMVVDTYGNIPLPEKKPSTPIAVDVDDLTKLERCLLYVAKMPDSIQGQGGDECLKNVAFKAAVDFDLDYENTLYILDVYNDRAQPPWLYRDLQNKARRISNNKFRFPERIGCKLIEKAVDYNWCDDVPDIAFSSDDEIGGAA